MGSIGDRCGATVGVHTSVDSYFLFTAEINLPKILLLFQGTDAATKGIGIQTLGLAAWYLATSTAR